MNKTTITTAVVGLIVGVILGYGAFHKTYVQVNVPVGGSSSAAGTSNLGSREAAVVMLPLTASATTTSILNTDGSDRAITSSSAFCTGLGTSNAFTGGALASLLVQMSTSTVGFAGLQSNANYAGNLTIATTTSTYYTGASTTETFPQYFGRIWPSNTYLNITFNATNTGTCTVGVKYMVL